MERLLCGDVEESRHLRTVDNVRQWALMKGDLGRYEWVRPQPDRQWQ